MADAIRLPPAAKIRKLLVGRLMVFDSKLCRWYKNEIFLSGKESKDG